MNVTFLLHLQLAQMHLVNKMLVQVVWLVWLYVEHTR